MLRKKEISEYVGKYKDSLFVEKFLQSRPYQALRILTKRNGISREETLGLVPKNIYSWFKLTLMDNQPRYINVIRFKFL